MRALLLLLLAGCGPVPAALAVPPATARDEAARHTSQATHRPLCRFTGVPDGANPTAGVVPVDGALYGTSQGGAFNKGALYRVTSSSKETILYSFQGAPDGESPQAAPIVSGGKLYGTT